MLTPTIIEGPLQRLGVRTPDEYRAKQAQLIANNARNAPHLTHGTVHESDAPIAAHVGCGAWRVKCACGEAPPADPDWRLACCSGCGTIHTAVTFPAERAQIEELLLARPMHGHRNWQAGESIADLVAEQHAHGDPVPAAFRSVRAITVDADEVDA